MNLEGIGFPAGASIYFNDNLCPQYKDIWMKYHDKDYRMLKQEKLLLYVWSDNGVIKIKRDLTSKSTKVRHVSVLHEMFPNFKFERKNSSS